MSDSTYEANREFLREVCEYAAALPHATPYFREKYRKLLEPRDSSRIIRLFKYQLEVTGIDPGEKVVLDAGCGSGRCSFLFLLLGAKHVTAVDLFEENIRALESVVRRFAIPIDPVHGDVSATRLPPSTFGIVFCTEAISHFRDWRAFVVETARLLERDGRVLIADWNNGANPFVRRAAYKFWQRSECGPFRASDFEPGAQNIPYLFRRWMIIRRTFPQISDEEVFQLGLRTFGKGGEELRAICEESSRTGRLPQHTFRWGASQSRPEDAQRNEEPVDPRDLVRALRKVGVSAQVRPHFGLTRSRVLPLLNRVATVMPGASLFFARKYIVNGRKQ